MGSSACTTKRYYQLAGVTVAVRDSSTTALTYLLGDQLGSTTVSVNSAGGTPVVQRYLPYGASRSTSGTAVQAPHSTWRQLLICRASAGASMCRRGS